MLKGLRTLSVDGSLADEHLGAVVAVDEGGLKEHGLLLLLVGHGAAVPVTPAPAPVAAVAAAAVVAALVLLSRRVQEVRRDERGLRTDMF